jgi:hypothetical protein
VCLKSPLISPYLFLNELSLKKGEGEGETFFLKPSSLCVFASWREKKPTGSLLGKRLTRRREDAKTQRGKEGKEIPSTSI